MCLIAPRNLCVSCRCSELLVLIFHCETKENGGGGQVKVVDNRGDEMNRRRDEDYELWILLSLHSRHSSSSPRSRRLGVKGSILPSAWQIKKKKCMSFLDPNQQILDQALGDTSGCRALPGGNRAVRAVRCVGSCSIPWPDQDRNAKATGGGLSS